VAFAAALEQLYREGNPTVDEFEWRLTVAIARGAGSISALRKMAVDEGLDPEQVQAITALIYG
jgi:hypothetical protein